MEYPKGICDMMLPPGLIERARRNIQTRPGSAEIQKQSIAAALPWVRMSDEALWSLMFGPTLTRSWMVLSNGECPACQTPVPMYNWEIDALNRPWKTRCPHCKELFPKNDFAAYYQSGLDAHGLFDPQKADRSLLFNADHPDPRDPQHRFGVDDGEGFVQAGKRWRFIGAYLIYGQWKQAVLRGMNVLSEAYVLTGDIRYAHKAAILLDRVADLYPSFDHNTQAWVYETNRGEGYVSVWHDACEETRELALAYDRIRPGLAGDKTLTDFLSAQACRHGLTAPKNSAEDIRRHIETGILRDAIQNPKKIQSNYPRREITLALIHRILGTPDHHRESEALIQDLIAQATAVDGVTGEKGLANYSGFVIQALAVFLAQLDQADPAILPDLIQRYPALKQTYRFFIDTLCLDQYYPLVGDAGWFAARPNRYVGVNFLRSEGLHPSMFTFLWRLYEITGDAAYVQILCRANEQKLDGLPYDLFHSDPAQFQRQVAEVIARHGATPELSSVDKTHWHLAILRSGQGERRRAAWMAYDSGGGHGHANGMNLGLFAYGLDLMPDFGYPPVQFGGWNSPRATWYTLSAAHNTVVVDGQNHKRDWQKPEAGQTTLWADAPDFHVMRASNPRIVFNPVETIPFDLSGPNHDRIGFYLFREGRIGPVRVYTCPAQATSTPAEWTLQFEDTFNRTELGPDWKILDGTWRIENGQMVGSGLVVCTRPFPGQQRLDYEASSRVPEPGDLSAFLAGNENGFLTGALFGFGSDDNRFAKLLLLRTEVLRQPASIKPGHLYSISCRHENQRLIQIVDGQTTLDYLNSREEARRKTEMSLNDKQFERTVAMIDTQPVNSQAGSEFYLIDLFRVSGGNDHSKFMHSHFGTIQTTGLSLQPTLDYGVGTQMRNFQMDPHPTPGWTVDWSVEDRYHFRPSETNLHLRYTDLTPGAQAFTCEGWITEGGYDTPNQTWIPRILTRRLSTGQSLSSTFIALIEPYRQASAIRSARRLTLENAKGLPFGDAHVALEITRVDGEKHLFLSADVENPARLIPSRQAGDVLTQNEWKVCFDGDTCLIRQTAEGKPLSVTLCKARSLILGNWEIQLKDRAPDFVQIRFNENGPLPLPAPLKDLVAIRPR